MEDGIGSKEQRDGASMLISDGLNLVYDRLPLQARRPAGSLGGAIAPAGLIPPAALPRRNP